jgi:hypothetical protein
MHVAHPHLGKNAHITPPFTVYTDKGKRRPGKIILEIMTKRYDIIITQGQSFSEGQ